MGVGGSYDAVHGNCSEALQYSFVIGRCYDSSSTFEYLTHLRLSEVSLTHYCFIFFLLCLIESIKIEFLHREPLLEDV